jgi:hypothetical protein
MAGWGQVDIANADAASENASSLDIEAIVVLWE